MPDIATVPLARCRLAPQNARKASRGPIDGLVASIRSEGLLDPLHGYREGGRVMVWDGGRRLRAIKRLARTQSLPENLAEGVPILISERAAAERGSLVTFVREGLHPVEELRAYKVLFDAGQDPDAIAAAMGVEARRVAQLLKLSGLAPEVLAAFEAGAFGLDTAQAFTLTDDLERQREVLAVCEGCITAHRVRQMLKSGMTSPRERLARFVGREAYLAAGGGVLTDLFASGPDEETWTDSGLVERLAAEKREAAVAAVKAEGWAWVKVLEPYDYGWSHGYRRLVGAPVPFSSEDQAAWDEAEQVLEDQAASQDERDAAEAVIARLEARQDTTDLTAEQRAGAGAFVQLDSDGRLTIRQGYVEAERAAPAKARTAPDGDPERYGWGHTGHWRMTHIATAAVRHALLEAPDVAYDVLVARLALAIAGGVATSPVQLDPRGVVRGVIPAEARLEGEAAWAERLEAWRERLPQEGFVAVLDYTSGLAPADKAEIVAIGVGLALDAVESRFDHRRPAVWAGLGAILGRLGLDLAQAWSPDAGFLAKGSKAALAAALAETGEAEPTGKLKKAEMITRLTTRLARMAWLPRVLRELGGAIEGETEMLEREAPRA